MKIRWTSMTTIKPTSYRQTVISRETRIWKVDTIAFSKSWLPSIALIISLIRFYTHFFDSMIKTTTNIASTATIVNATKPTLPAPKKPLITLDSVLTLSQTSTKVQSKGIFNCEINGCYNQYYDKCTLCFKSLCNQCTLRHPCVDEEIDDVLKDSDGNITFKYDNTIQHIELYIQFIFCLFANVNASIILYLIPSSLVHYLQRLFLSFFVSFLPSIVYSYLLYCQVVSFLQWFYFFDWMLGCSHFAPSLAHLLVSYLLTMLFCFFSCFFNNLIDCFFPCLFVNYIRTYLASMLVCSLLCFNFFIKSFVPCLHACFLAFSSLLTSFVYIVAFFFPTLYVLLHLSFIRYIHTKNTFSTSNKLYNIKNLKLPMLFLFRWWLCIRKRW